MFILPIIIKLFFLFFSFLCWRAAENLYWGVELARYKIFSSAPPLPCVCPLSVRLCSSALDWHRVRQHHDAARWTPCPAGHPNITASTPSGTNIPPLHLTSANMNLAKKDPIRPEHNTVRHPLIIKARLDASGLHQYRTIKNLHPRHSQRRTIRITMNFFFFDFSLLVKLN